MKKQINLSENLVKLNEIADWFNDQTQVDVETGLSKVKEAAALIKDSKSRLKEIENEFAEIQSDISLGIDSDSDVILKTESIEISEIDQSSQNTDDDISF